MELKDSGTRKRYSTGAMKDKTDEGMKGKGAYHLVPPWVIRQVAEIYRKGSIKYHERNWEMGLPLCDFLDSAERHLGQFHEGMIDEDHLHQAIWNLIGLSQTMHMIKIGRLSEDLNDLPSYGPPGDPNYRPVGPGLVKKMEEIKKEMEEKQRKMESRNGYLEDVLKKLGKR